MRKRFLVPAAVVAILLLITLAPWNTVLSQPPEEVVVSNLPEVVPIKGDVTVVGTARHGTMVRRLNLIVPPVARTETDNLVQAEAVETDGFTTVALSLQGEVRNTILRTGAVGALLLPDEEPFREAMREKGLLHLPLEVTATLPRKEEASFAAQEHFALSFPRYRVYLYNSTDRTVDVNLYLYLTY